MVPLGIAQRAGRCRRGGGWGAARPQTAAGPQGTACGPAWERRRPYSTAAGSVVSLMGSTTALMSIGSRVSDGFLFNTAR